MDDAVFGVCMGEIAAAIPGAADGAWAAREVANDLGWDASTTEAMGWDDWVNQLDHRIDAAMFSWVKDLQRLLDEWPYADTNALFDVHRRWRERYDRLCGAYARAYELERVGDLSPGDLAIAVDYRRALDLLWSGAWWWLGWLGRYIHHRTKDVQPP